MLKIKFALGLTLATAREIFLYVFLCAFIYLETHGGIVTALAIGFIFIRLAIASHRIKQQAGLIDDLVDFQNRYFKEMHEIGKRGLGNGKGKKKPAACGSR